MCGGNGCTSNAFGRDGADRIFRGCEGPLALSVSIPDIGAFASGVSEPQRRMPTKILAVFRTGKNLANRCVHYSQFFDQITLPAL